MAFAIPSFELSPIPASPEPPALIRTANRENVLWNRPVFKAPPLQVHPQPFDATMYARDLCRIGLVQR